MLLENPIVKLATFQACLDCICDTSHTPYIAVNTNHPEYRGLLSPVDANGIIILDISGIAVSGFNLDIEGISFFYAEGGQKRGQGFVPMGALVAIFAKEDPSIGQEFPVEKVLDIEQDPVKVESIKPIKKGWTPRLIKGGKS